MWYLRLCLAFRLSLWLVFRLLELSTRVVLLAFRLSVWLVFRLLTVVVDVRGSYFELHRWSALSLLLLTDKLYLLAVKRRCSDEVVG